MRFVFFVHSLISDWNHGNAHFLRGIVKELLERKHQVSVYEPVTSWSMCNLIHNYGPEAVDSFYRYYPGLCSTRYVTDKIVLETTLDGADVVVVHEWNDPELVGRIGKHRKLHNSYCLFFHDTHHRSVSDPESMKKYDLSNYDGVLAFGEIIRQIYLERSWIARAWTWHEAADTRVFKPLHSSETEGEIVWIGNWGDEERGAELNSFLFEPVKTLNVSGRIYGVRYPSEALLTIRNSGLEYSGWIPNYLVPEVFSGYKLTVHIPRRPYVEMLPGIPTIRPFEALACGIPLICSPWNDCEHLFDQEKDFLMAKDSDQMKQYIGLILNDKDFASQMILHGRETILARHTCVHRVDQLLQICEEMGIKKSNEDSQFNATFANGRGTND